MSVGTRTIIYKNTCSSLDYDLETTVAGIGGPFSPDEMMLVLLIPVPLGLLTMLPLMPFIKTWGILSVIPWFLVAPKIIMRMKKNQVRSYLWDFMHRRGLTFASRAHFRRPGKIVRFGAMRSLVKGTWTSASKAGLMPIHPSHLTYGLPAIRIYNPEKGFSAPITPQVKLDGYAIMSRVRVSKPRPRPEYLRHAVLALDENGHAAIDMWGMSLTPWRYGKQSDQKREGAQRGK